MNTKLKCLLLDDELLGLTYLKMLCEQIPELEVVKAFNNPETFINEFPNLSFDLCILDIEMPQLNGLQVAKLLKGKPVIFITAYKEYAADAFDLDAIDYVRKPVTLERLQQTVQKAFKRLESNITLKSYLYFNTNKGKALIFFDQLCYINCSDIDSRDKIAWLKDGTTLTLKNISFERLNEFLPYDNFCRINKKEIISLKSIKFFSGAEIDTNIANKSGGFMKFTLTDIYKNDFIKKVKI